MKETNIEFNFDKFVQDLEKREKQKIQKQKGLQCDEEMWQRRELQRRYQEHVGNRIRYDK
jgi:hypothetical protein